MGSQNFSETAKGKTAEAAFSVARSTAQYEYGHRGYTGSLAEKDSFALIALPEGKTAEAFAQELMDEDDERINNKWGPAGCIAMGGDTYLFFGWAAC